MSDEDPLLDTAAVADIVNLPVTTIRIYLKRTRARVAEGLPARPHDFPVQDETFGRSPVWHRSTIEAWLSARPGPGRRTAE
jgi:predicted DNA-binding transcriptional regulator AlpA